MLFLWSSLLSLSLAEQHELPGPLQPGHVGSSCWADALHGDGSAATLNQPLVNEASAAPHGPHGGHCAPWDGDGEGRDSE